MSHNSMNKVLKIISVLLWSGLAGLRLLDAWQDTQIVPALLAAQSGLIAWLLVMRGQQSAETSLLQKAVAWASALLPLALRIHHETLVGQMITGLGLLFVLWALGTLERSFGIAPADRGLVKDGPYRFIRHPMYLGELITLAGVVIGDPSFWNCSLMLVLSLSLVLRIRWEEQAIFNYSGYAGRVRWRLIPHLW